MGFLLDVGTGNGGPLVLVPFDFFKELNPLNEKLYEISLILVEDEN